MQKWLHLPLSPMGVIDIGVHVRTHPPSNGWPLALLLDLWHMSRLLKGGKSRQRPIIAAACILR
jgi:hypothetical protein